MGIRASETAHTSIEWASMTISIIAILASHVFLFFENQSAIMWIIVATSSLIVWRPVIPLATYIGIYPMVAGSESLNPLKISIFGLTVLLISYSWIKSTPDKKTISVRSEYQWMYLFFLYLCLSPLIGFFGNTFSLIDWARDIAPMLNLLLIPLFARYFRQRENAWLFYFLAISVFLCTLFSIPSFARYTMSQDNPFEFGTPLMYLSPPLALGLSFIMFTSMVQHRRLWLIFGLANLLCVSLSHTRTHWVGTVTVMLTSIILTYKRKLLDVLPALLATLLIGFFAYFALDTQGLIERQSQRFYQFVHLRDDVSARARMDELTQVGQLFLSSPIVGMGFGYQYDFYRYWAKRGTYGYEYQNNTHSDVMYILSKGGLPGLLLFFLMLFGMVRCLWKMRKTTYDIRIFAWSTFGIVLIINSLIIGTSTPIFQARFNMLTLSTIIAYVLSLKDERAAEPSTPMQHEILRLR